MKITKKLLVLILVCFLALSPICLATNNPVARSENEDKASTGTQSIHIMNTDLYIADQDVVIEDAINGNVFACGNTVTVKGHILGDLFVIGNNLIVEKAATIDGNIFACTSTFTMKGSCNDIYAFSKDFELASDAYIFRDVKLYSQTITLNGSIKKDAFIAMQTLKMPENAKNLIGGNLNYVSETEFTIPDEAVLGEVKYTEYKEVTPTTADIISTYLTSFITTIIYAIVVILLATFFAPKFIEKSSYAIMKKSFASAGIGILAFVLVPIIAIVLLMTGFLSYISIAMLAVYGLVLSITLPIFSMAIAKFIEKKVKNPTKRKFILFSILSAIVLWLLQIIPVIGGYITLFIFVVGLGVFLYAFFIRKDVSELEETNTK